MRALPGGDYEGTHIYVGLVGDSASGKTRLWRVSSKGGDALGLVKWYAPWRRYAFHPEPGTIFEWQCLHELADFAEGRTREKKKDGGTSGGS